MGLGFLTACWIHSEAILLDFVSLSMTPVVLLSEMFFPVSELPSWLRLVGDLLPSTQLVRLFRMCLGGAVSPDALVIPGGILLAWLVVSFFLSTRLFSWHRS
jgi:ABC-type multidrug transport system permease subunit